MAFTSTLNNNILNHVFRNEPYTSPTSVYVALFTSANNEISGSDYERKKITFGAPSNNEIKNNEEVRFSIATDGWGTITHAGIFDSETGGNRLEQAVMNSPREVRENDQFVIAVGNYTVKLG